MTTRGLTVENVVYADWSREEMEEIKQGLIERQTDEGWREYLTYMTEYWKEIPGAPGPGTVEQLIEQVAAMFAEHRRKSLGSWPIQRHVLRRMAVDLMCASFLPPGSVPQPLVRLMQLALDLPEDHEPMLWPIAVGTRDNRGNPGRGDAGEARTAAMRFDVEHMEKHHKPMELTMLNKRVNAELGTKKDRRKSLRDWRMEEDYWRTNDIWPVDPRSLISEKKGEGE